MSQALLQTKKRIKSVESTSKITKSMKLVSSAKLRSIMYLNDSYKSYSKKLDEMIALLINASKENENEFFISKDSPKRLIILITSSLGLCGSYNHNIYSFFFENVTKDDDVIIVGNKGISHFKNSEYNIINNIEYNGIKDEITIKKIENIIKSSYLSNGYKEVDIIYTDYKNSIRFIPKMTTIFPIQNASNKKAYGVEPIFEPDVDTLIETMIPLYLSNKLYAILLTSEVSEQASRRNAMENATNNAEDLVSRLKLEYNKQRQSAITQEIIEVSSVSNN